eukprot:GHVN01001068.1.p1 GENE.GHVN01001068.1~~GHVN01001068.1.p1  ORF type:complete len:1282 (+),score=150.17 GHVN01001068.1:9822-13667(+)
MANKQPSLDSKEDSAIIDPYWKGPTPHSNQHLHHVSPQAIQPQSSTQTSHSASISDFATSFHAHHVQLWQPFADDKTVQPSQGAFSKDKGEYGGGASSGMWKAEQITDAGNYSQAHEKHNTAPNHSGAQPQHPESRVSTWSDIWTSGTAGNQTHRDTQPLVGSSPPDGTNRPPAVGTADFAQSQPSPAPCGPSVVPPVSVISSSAQHPNHVHNGSQLENLVPSNVPTNWRLGASDHPTFYNQIGITAQMMPQTSEPSPATNSSYYVQGVAASQIRSQPEFSVAPEPDAQATTLFDEDHSFDSVFHNTPLQTYTRSSIHAHPSSLYSSNGPQALHPFEQFAAREMGASDPLPSEPPSAHCLSTTPPYPTPSAHDQEHVAHHPPGTALGGAPLRECGGHTSHYVRTKSNPDNGHPPLWGMPLHPPLNGGKPSTDPTPHRAPEGRRGTAFCLGFGGSVVVAGCGPRHSTVFIRTRYLIQLLLKGETRGDEDNIDETAASERMRVKSVVRGWAVSLMRYPGPLIPRRTNLSPATESRAHLSSTQTLETHVVSKRNVLEYVMAKFEEIASREKQTQQVIASPIQIFGLWAVLASMIDSGTVEPTPAVVNKLFPNSGKPATSQLATCGESGESEGAIARRICDAMNRAVNLEVAGDRQTDPLGKFCKLICTGNTQDVVRFATHSQLWDPLLAVCPLLGWETYRESRIKYAEAVIQHGGFTSSTQSKPSSSIFVSAVHALLTIDAFGPMAASRSGTGTGADGGPLVTLAHSANDEEFLKSWSLQLSVVCRYLGISYPSTKHFIKAIADRLMKLNEIEWAHCLFLLSNDHRKPVLPVPLDHHVTQGGRFPLLGCSSTSGSLVDAVQLTELYWYIYREANLLKVGAQQDDRQAREQLNLRFLAVILPFQLEYAQLLADVGLIQPACNYTQFIADSLTRISSAQSQLSPRSSSINPLKWVSGLSSSSVAAASDDRRYFMDPDVLSSHTVQCTDLKQRLVHFTGISSRVASRSNTRHMPSLRNPEAIESFAGEAKSLPNELAFDERKTERHQTSDGNGEAERVRERRGSRAMSMGITGLLGGLAKTVKKALVAEDRQVGVENQFYYDNELKRWRRKGEEDNRDPRSPEPVLTLGPPPTTSPQVPKSQGQQAVDIGVRSRYVDVLRTYPPPSKEAVAPVHTDRADRTQHPPIAASFAVKPLYSAYSKAPSVTPGTIPTNPFAAVSRPGAFQPCQAGGAPTAYGAPPISWAPSSTTSQEAPQDVRPATPSVSFPWGSPAGVSAFPSPSADPLSR